MAQPTDETIWQAVTGVAASVVAAVLGALGIQYRTYKRDRRTLYELRREMDEVNEVRKRSDDCRLPMAGLEQLKTRTDTLASGLEAIAERQDDMEATQTKMMQTLSRIDERTEMIWDSMK